MPSDFPHTLLRALGRASGCVPRHRRLHVGNGLAALCVALALWGCAGLPGGQGTGYTEVGYASWYGPGFHGRRAANGEIYDQSAMTAAHKYLPFGTLVEVERRDSGERVVVRVNDRGPFVGGRVIDLSRGAAEQLGAIGPGVVPVRLRVVKLPNEDERTYRGRIRGPYAVQLGVFNNADGAHATMVRLAPSLPDIRIVRTPNGALRLLAGSYDSYEEATRRARDIRSSLVDGAFVVTDPGDPRRARRLPSAIRAAIPAPQPASVAPQPAFVAPQSASVAVQSAPDAPVSSGPTAIATGFPEPSAPLATATAEPAADGGAPIVDLAPVVIAPPVADLPVSSPR
ncbi:MAG: septal ring lytic transglycosylase RlpA family protein [Nitrospirota bacterium]|nr:septal ring lytic transglycosylase RlpA family protein [Nitrospirota bacterium]